MCLLGGARGAGGSPVASKRVVLGAGGGDGGSTRACFFLRKPGLKLFPPGKRGHGFSSGVKGKVVGSGRVGMGMSGGAGW